MSAPFRFPRAVAFTAAMFALASGAHVLAGGSLPAPAIFAGLIALALAPVMVLAKIRVTAPVMAVLLIASQIVLHEAFNALSVPTGLASVSADHQHGTWPPVIPAEAFAPGGTAAPGVLMLILHSAATLATALVLARSEAAVWALAAWLRPLIRILIAVVVPDWPHLPAPDYVVMPSRWRNLRLPALRGPPRIQPAI
ncbi:hypothetical protein QFZ60_002412 [Arthrobacter sp. B2I5]|nr:hypothetical protein [Arthrobacter sp. B2I5]